MANLFIPQAGFSTFNALAPVTVTQAAGAAGWIADVDVSGSLPAACAGHYCLFLVGANVAGAATQNAGIRDVDIAEDTKITVGNFSGGYGYTALIAKISSTRTVDLYREATNNLYIFMGYFS